MTNTYQIVRNAILGRQQVTAIYKRLPREMCPHILGWNEKGEEQALFYQFGGQSKHGLGPDGSSKNWRCIVLAELANVALRAGPWHTASLTGRTGKGSDCVHRVDITAAKPAYSGF